MLVQLQVGDGTKNIAVPHDLIRPQMVMLLELIKFYMRLVVNLEEVGTLLRGGQDLKVFLLGAVDVSSISQGSSLTQQV